MRLMPSRFGPGYYLGCTKYPKCKGKGQVSGELQKKIDAALAEGAGGPKAP
jgi:DNA topoisomerase-1